MDHFPSKEKSFGYKKFLRVTSKTRQAVKNIHERIEDGRIPCCDLIYFILRYLSRARSRDEMCIFYLNLSTRHSTTGRLEMGDTEGGGGHFRVGNRRMQHLQQVDEHIYKYASTQNRQDNAKH